MNTESLVYAAIALIGVSLSVWSFTTAIRAGDQPWMVGVSAVVGLANLAFLGYWLAHL